MRLQEILLKAKKSPGSIDFVNCPICSNTTCVPGEWLEHTPVSPDCCFVCGWQSSNGTEAYPDNSDYVEKCWQLQIAPYNDLDME